MYCVVPVLTPFIVQVVVFVKIGDPVMMLTWVGVPGAA